MKQAKTGEHPVVTVVMPRQVKVEGDRQTEQRTDTAREEQQEDHGCYEAEGDPEECLAVGEGHGFTVIEYLARSFVAVTRIASSNVA